MKKPSYLTKSRFKLALECETKLYYTGKNEYPDKKKTNDFLKALAEGGFQVGELAKLYFPNGIEIESLDKKESLKQTNKYLKQKKVVLFEAAVKYKNLFIRIDVLVKDGKNFELIEVKSKSTEDTTTNAFIKRRTLSSSWKPYVYDVAFQKYVLQQSYPDYKIKSYLMLINKNASAKIDSLNQNFFLYKEAGRIHVKTKKRYKLEELSDLLVKIPVDDLIQRIWDGDITLENQKGNFSEWIRSLASSYEGDDRIETGLGRKCKKCEFVCSKEEELIGKKSGFKECWKRVISTKDNTNNLVIELWNSRNIDKYFKQDKYLLSDLTELDILTSKIKADKGLSAEKRRWLQVTRAKQNSSEIYIDREDLKKEMEGWKYPLHFIDFETSMVAIPFYKNQHPYEGIAFQFSHHCVYADGKIKHKAQFISDERGVFPNFEFLRVLKKKLNSDNGTIFRYGSHENTYLNFIYNQLEKSNEDDRDELLTWIREITQPSSANKDRWEPGKRNMVDMLDLVKKYYYNPLTCGSNSIKAVLPATIRSSAFLQEKYSKPIYGKGKEIDSLNFDEVTWITRDDNGIIDPYKLLPPVFPDLNKEEIDNFLVDPELRDGGATMIAFAKLQFTEMTDRERKYVINALLKYCELDTLAMVMIYEAWRNFPSSRIFAQFNKT